MKKLMNFCFVILITVLSALACFNFIFDGIDKIEGDKATIVIQKPGDVSNSAFLSAIDNALGDIHADIMLRQIERDSDKKSVYNYYKTNHTPDFLSVSTSADNIFLNGNECISTKEPNGFRTHHLNVSPLLQDISFYSWEQAENCDLSAGTYYIRTGNIGATIDAIQQLGYTVTVQSSTYISGKFSVLLFGFVPAFMLIASMVFYVLSNGKRNVLKKMEGYTTKDILADEIKQIAPMFIISFLAVEALALIVATILYKQAIIQFIIFLIPYLLLFAGIIIAGLIVSCFFIATQKSAEHIKGKVPKRGIYITTLLAKCVFVTFIIFFLTIAIRNAIICSNTIQTAQFVSDKVAGYVTLPVYQNNTSAHNLSDNYKAFYEATVEKYQGVLIDASNYEYNLITGRTPAEEYGQDYITINRNYLKLNTIYNTNGQAIDGETLPVSAFNVLLPETKLDETEKYRELVQSWYSQEVNFITYDIKESPIYTYNANTGTGANGKLDAPVILIADDSVLDGLMLLSYCSQGSYFLKVPSENPYIELLPILRETGIDTSTLSTPSISAAFEETINHQTMMLILYGTQSAILLAGLLCLILFSAKLYCENYKAKIAACLIEGYSLFSCMRKHLLITIIYYGIAVFALRFVSMVMQVTLNYPLLLATFIGELIITIFVSRNYTRQNLYQIVKGAE